MDDSWMLPCISKKLTGMDCPGCGIQRSISFLAQGQIKDSIIMYPGLIPVIFLFGILVVDLLFPIKNGEAIKLWATIIAIGTIIISYIYKMIFI